MSDLDRYWLAAVVAPQIVYWFGWAVLMPNSGLTFWLLPAYKQAYVLGIIPTTLWSLGAALDIWPPDDTGEWPTIDSVRS